MATYVNNLRLTELATGEGSGTWGTTTNTNLELIGQALGFGTRAIANASTDNITIADGVSDADRAMYLKLTGGGQACTVTILPNTTSKVWWMENATSYTLTFTCGSGANVAVLAGETKCISTDGLGSGGAVYDVLTDVNLAGTTKVDDLVVGDALTVGGTLGVTGVLTTTAATVFNGGFASNADSTLGTDKKVQFRDSAIYINSSADGQLDIVADTEIQIAATTIDINGAINASGEIIAASLDISGDIDVDGTTNLDVVDIDGAVDMASTLAVGGVVTANAGVVVDNFTLDGTTLALSSGNMLIDVAGDLTLDQGGGDLILSDDGTIVGTISINDSNLKIRSRVSDKDIYIQGNDGGVEFNALTLDMSEAGAATFNAGITIPDYVIHSGNTTTKFGFPSANLIDFTTNGTERLTLAGSYTVFNESGADVDFRVESDAYTHALFVDAGANHVNINGSTDFGGALNVNGGLNSKQAVFTSTNNRGLALSTATRSGQNDGVAIVDAQDTESTGGRLELHTMGAERARFERDQIVFNEGSNDQDFRVESDGNANALFVDGGANHIGMGTATLNRSGLGADHIVLTVGADTEMGMLELQGTRTSDADLGRISFLNAGTRRAEIVAARIDADNSTKLYFQTSNAGSLGTRLTIGKDGAATFNSSVLGSIINAGVSSSVGIGTATADANVAELGSGYLNLGRDDTADAAQIAFSKNGVLHSSIVTDNNDLRIKGNTSNLGIRFDGSDNGSNITALRLDISAAGAATFNSSVVVNESGADANFRVESDTNANALIVDAGLSHVGINRTANSVVALSINSTATDSSTYALEACNSSNATKFHVRSDGHSVFYKTGNAFGFVHNTDGGITTTPDAGGHAVFNEASADVDFRVESDNDANAFFVQGSNGFVGIGTGSPVSITGAAGPILDMQGPNPEIVFHDNDGTANAMSMYYLNDTLRWWGDGAQNMSLDNSGNLTVAGALSKGSGSFKIDHPLPAKTETHNLVHSFIEGPQADNIYRGKVTLVDGSANGKY
jgi:cytoskeletal protein CcmA (bactofilin family)